VHSPGLEHADEFLTMLAYVGKPIAGNCDLADACICIGASLECVDTLHASQAARQSFNVNHAIQAGADQRVHGNSIEAGHQSESLESSRYIAR
jgi:hypothetical protein